jgi:hypothetical protein
MIGMAILVVVVAVAAGVFLSLGRRGRAAGAGAWRGAGGAAAAATQEEGSAIAPRREVPAVGALAGDLSRWVGAGLMSAEQADAIAGFERASLTGPGATGGERRVSLLAEALGYVGVVLALAGAAVGLAQGWEDLPLWARLVIPAAATGLLLLGGFLLRRQEEPAFRRLMSVLWVLAVGGLAWTLAVLGVEVIDWDAGVDGEPIALVTAGGCTVLAGVLYLLRRHGLQQAALLASLHALLVSSLLVALPDTDPPMWWFAAAIWLLGLAWAALGWSGMVEPGWLAVAFGCAGALVGPAIGLGEIRVAAGPGAPHLGGADGGERAHPPDPAARSGHAGGLRLHHLGGGHLLPGQPGGAGGPGDRRRGVPGAGGAGRGAGHQEPGKAGADR